MLTRSALEELREAWHRGRAGAYVVVPFARVAIVLCPACADASDDLQGAVLVRTLGAAGPVVCNVCGSDCLRPSRADLTLGFLREDRAAAVHGALDNARALDAPARPDGPTPF